MIHILIIEPDNHVRFAMNLFIRDYHYETNIYACSREALAYLEKTARTDLEPKLAIISADVGLEEVAADIICMRRNLPTIKVICTTAGMFSPEEEGMLKSVGVDEIMEKPFKLDLFMPTIRRLLTAHAQ